jgi:hypothetical protein
MPSNTAAQDDSGDRIPRWAATAGHHTLGQRLTAMGARLFRSRADANNDEAELSWRVRKLVLGDYHATNLATARTVSEELVRAGFNTGDVPYGYRARRVRVTPTGRRPRWRTRLVIEPVEASTVRMIFVWRVEQRLSTKEIRHRLTASRYPAPLDPSSGQPGVWTAAMVRAILRNPKYLGRQVWDAATTGGGFPARSGCGRMSGCTRRWSPPTSSPQTIHTPGTARDQPSATPRRAPHNPRLPRHCPPHTSALDAHATTPLVGAHREYREVRTCPWPTR